MQMEALECGAASLAMILAYHGKVIKCGYVKADSDTFWLGEPVETPQLLLSTCGADSSKRLVVWCELPQEEEEMTEENIKDIEILDFD